MHDRPAVAQPMDPVRAILPAVVLVARLRTFARTRAARHLLVVLAVGFALRLGWALWAARTHPQSVIESGDQYSYWYFGNDMAHGNGYRSYMTGKPTSYYPVGFPALLAVVYWIGMHTPLPDNQAHLTAGLHVLLSTASIALVYFIARKAFTARIGIIAAAIVALFPSLILGVATFSVETTFIFTFLLCVAILVDHDWSSGPMSRRHLLWFGLALGCSVVVRPFSFPIMIGLGVAALCAGRGWRGALRHLGWATIPFLLMLMPLTIRNEIVFHRFIPISTNLGDGMCMSRFPGSNGGFSWADHAWCADPNLPEEVRNPANTRAGLRFIVRNPGEELRQIPKRFLLMMEQDHGILPEVLGNGSHLTLPSAVYNAITFTTDGYYHLSWMLALPGLGLLFLGWRRDRRCGPRRAIIGVTLIGLQLLPIASWGNPRFHIPMLPLLAIIDAASIMWVIDRIRRHNPAALQTSTAPDQQPADAQDSDVPAGAMNTAVG
ncbi:unannotated protein [freshwater metagenome]|uniref:Unannotated protein n=1 Tax=freshwater metagenome TaxID=449393 RepID=A0A6J7DRW1_9ZZZZ